MPDVVEYISSRLVSGRYVLQPTRSGFNNDEKSPHRPRRCRNGSSNRGHPDRPSASGTARWCTGCRGRNDAASASDLPRCQIAITRASVTSSLSSPAYRLADKAAEKEIDNSSHIEPTLRCCPHMSTLRCPHISEVSNPFAVGNRRVKVRSSTSQRRAVACRSPRSGSRRRRRRGTC